MDYLTYSSLIAAVLSAMVAMVMALLLTRRREVERRSQEVLEEIRLRETELKYASAVNAQTRRAAIDLVWKSLHALDRLEEDDAVRGSATLRTSLRSLRGIQYAQLEALLEAFDEDRGEQDLGQLRGLLNERRTELNALPGDGEGSTRG